MNAPTVEELTRFIRFLGHERFAIKSVKTGEKGAQEAHFDLINANRAVDYIKLRNGKRQLWVNVNRLKRDSKKFHDFDDVEAVTNIFIDVDAKKPDDKKDFAATERERGVALAQLPTVQGWLSTKGLKPGLGFKSGNGGGLLLPVPPTEPTPEFIAKVAAFLKVVRKEADVDIDTATFDPPRVCGILGTWNSKFEDEAEGRKNHLREVIGEIPQRDEDEKLLAFIEGLTPDPDALKTWAEKFNRPPATEEAEPEPPEDAGEIDVDFVREKLDALLEADPVLLGLLNWTEAAQERLKRNRSDAEFGAVGKLTAAGFTDPEINWIMTYISRIGKWSEEGEHYQRLTLRKIRANDAKEAAEAVRVEGGGYVADLPSGEKLRVSCKKENWFVEVSGGAFKPVQISDKPIWFDNRKWEKLPEKLGVDPGLWDQIRDDVRKLEGRRQADEKARAEEEGGEDGPEVSEEIKKKAREILETGDPIKARCDYVSRTVEGNTGVAKAFIYSCSSAYMPVSDKLHADAVGASQGGKSVTVGAVHSTYPPENLEILTEASPKSVYYLAKRYEDEGRSFDDVILYINDARVEHIPVLKVFRDDGPGAPRNLTVVDGESLDLVVPGRPIVQSSSVLPLRDDEGQAVSRSFLATVADVDEAGEKKVRGKIRQGLRYGALLRPEADTQKAVLQQMGRILRDEGIRDVLVPFDAPEPSSADRRGTGQFIRLIKISAHENQFQRPILELKDGRRFVVATYADLQNAAELWFEFEEAQAFKINHKVLKVFKALPTIEPDHYNFTGSSPSKNRIAKDTGISPKSVERYLSDLYDAGLIYRKKAGAPGNPHVFWTTDELRQKVMSQISATGDGEGELGQIETKNGCPKYLGKNCPDSLKNSFKAFFTNQDIIKKENVKGVSGISARGAWSVSGGDILSSLDFLANRVLNAPLEATDSEYLGQSVLSQMSEIPPAIDSKMGRILSRGGGNVSKDEDHHQTIAENLAEDRRRQAEEAERTKTPPPKGGEVSGAFRRVSGGVSVDDNDNGKEVSGVSVEKPEEEDDNVLPLRGAVGRDGEDISSNTCPGKTTETPESPSPLAVSTTETSPETSGKVRKPPEQKGDGDGVHGVHGGGRPLTLTLDEKKREGERKEREKREGKDRKLSPPSPPQPQDDGFGGVHGVHGGDTEAVAGEIPEPSDDYQSIAERTATPPPKPKGDEGRAPTSEEAEVLEDVARRILQNWPGIAEARLWELAREKLGSPLPLAVVKAWLKESGYTEAGRLNGSPLWNPPVGVIS